LETRKLIKFGGSSHIIAIPNEWIKKNSLGKGDTIYVEENGNNELILSPSIKEKKQIEKQIRIDANKKIQTIKREIISAYINNYNVIEISGNKLKQNRKEIEGLINNLVAIEIIEDGSNKIVARDFLKLEDVSVETIIRRMDTIIRSMAEKIDEEDKEEAYQEIKNLDRGINKLRFLLYKIVKSGIEDHNLATKLNLSNYELLNTRLMADNLEEIADELRRFMRFRKKIKLAEIEEKKINSCILDIKNSYIDVMEAYYKNNVEKAHEIASQKDIHLKKCDKMFKDTDNKDIIPIIEKIKSIQSWIRAIARGIIT